MAKTLLAVDDSVTMRKVLEITFSGEDFRVLTAESSQAALGKLPEDPSVVVVDTVLGAEDGYALAKEVRKRAPNASIIMLASRYSPYDLARGRDAGVDDWADKPFDTQQLIDKIRKIMTAKESSGGVAAPGPTAATVSAPYRAPAVVPAQVSPAPPPVQAYQPPPAPAASPSPAPSLGTGGYGRGTQQISTGAVPRPVAAPAPPAPPAPPIPAPAPAPIAAASVNGHMASKLGDLGLTPQQADAVMALSREVVERVVWEVVPQLAETMIKEEIARLTRA